MGSKIYLRLFEGSTLGFYEVNAGPTIAESLDERLGVDGLLFVTVSMVFASKGAIFYFSTDLVENRFMRLILISESVGMLGVDSSNPP